MLVAIGICGWVMPRAALPVASNAGNNAALACALAARLCSMRERALASDGLALCAASTNCTNTGSPKFCHH